MAKLKAKTRNNLPASEFALPDKRKDPIPDESHGRAALTMGMRDASPAEKAEIRAKVHAKFPELGGKPLKRSQGRFAGGHQAIGNHEGRNRL